jgi:hypothetical protein
MYSLAGFIQLLLILSQSDYLPDLSAVWVRESCLVATVSVSATGPALALPAVTVNTQKPSIAGTHRNKWILSPALQKNGWVPIPLSSTIPAGRVISSDKLYLMFCRLKIGG